MGAGIAQACIQAGLQAVLWGRSEQSLQRGLDGIAKSLGKLHARQKLAREPEHYLGLITTTSDYAAASGADLAIEAVVEDLAVKRRMLEQAESHLPAGALLASTTSALTIGQLAETLRAPESFLGLHFFSPAPLIKGVEVKPGPKTSPRSLEAGCDLVRRLGKEPIMVDRDQPGALVNRINYPSLLEAMALVESGAATVEELDRAVRLCLGRKLGIFEAGDLVGIDVTYAALLNMYEQTGNPRWRPPEIMRRKVEQGQLGRKTGAGWYRYDNEEG